MKKTTVAVMLFICFLAFPISVSAAEKKGNIAEDMIGEFKETIPSESGVDADEDSLISDFGFDGIFNRLLGSLGEKRSELVAFILSVTGFCVLSIIVESVGFSGEGCDRMLGAALFTVMSLGLYPRVYSIFSEVKTSLESISSFLGAALPAMTAITVASGAVKSAGVQAMNMNITLGIIGALCSRLLLPLSLSLLAFALISSFGDGMAAGVSKSIKGLFTFGLGLVSAISSAAIALQSVVASAADSASLRAARYAASSLIPVVGSSVSGALSTLAGGLAYAKSTVGAASIAVIVTLSLAPLVLLLIHRTVFSLAEAFMDYMDNARGKRCFSAYKSAFDAVISVYVMSTIICIIQVIVFIKGGVS